MQIHKVQTQIRDPGCISERGLHHWQRFIEASWNRDSRLPFQLQVAPDAVAKNNLKDASEKVPVVTISLPEEIKRLIHRNESISKFSFCNVPESIVTIRDAPVGCAYNNPLVVVAKKDEHGQPTAIRICLDPL